MINLPYLNIGRQRDLDKNLKKGRYVPKKINLQGGHKKANIKALQKENQVLRSKFNQLEKTLRKIINVFKGTNKKI